MKTKLSVTLTMLATALLIGTAQAQDTLVSTKTMDTIALSKNYITRWVTLQGGYGYIQNGPLNQFLAYNAPDLNRNLGTFGVSFQHEYKRWIGGVTLQGGMSGRQTVNNYAGTGMDYTMSNGFYNALVHLGYSIVSTSMVKVYPLLGLGVGRSSAHLDRTHISLSQIANNPPANNDISIGKTLGYVDIALAIDFFCPNKRMEEKPGKTSGGVFGLRVGYAQGLDFGGSWGYNGNNNVNENPAYNPGMFYAKVVIGMFKTHRSYRRF